ncbi:hypothetical protein ACRARG_01750 [Pseudooceanicola sp. C21-150M6]
MIRQIANLARRSSDTLIEDMLGAAALVVVLVGALNLPSLI